MSLYHFQDEKTHERRTRLFVINHSHKGDVVEIFDHSPEANTLTLVKTVSSDLFVTPKDIVAVDQDRFYLTNHHVSFMQAYIGEKRLRLFFSVKRQTSLSLTVCFVFG